MNLGKTYLNKTFILTNIGFAILFFLAYHYRFERLTYEAANEFMNIINEEGFIKSMERNVLLLSQVLTLIGLKLSWSLEKLIIAYSFNHILYFYLLFLVSALIYKNELSPLFLFIQVIGIDVAFYQWPFAELQYGLGASLFFYFTLEHEFKFNWPKYALLSVLLLFIFGAHPLNYVFFSLLILIYCSNNTFFRNKRIAFLSLILIVILSCEYFVIKNYNYKAISYGQDIILNSYNFINNPLRFLEIWVLFFASVALAFYYKKVSFLALIILSIVFSNLLVYLSNHSVDLYNVLPGMLVLFLPFYLVKETYLNVKLKQLIQFGLVMTFVFCIYRINLASESYTKRVFLVNELIDITEEKNTDKALLKNICLKSHDIEFFTGISIRDESLIHSALRGMKPCKLISNHQNLKIIALDNDINEEMNLELLKKPRKLANYFYGEQCAIETHPYFNCDDNLNSAYFDVDQNSPYLIIDSISLDLEQHEI